MEKEKTAVIQLLSNYTIYIIGASRFSNQVLSLALKTETAAKVRCILMSGQAPDLLNIPEKGLFLFLFDCRGKAIPDFIREDLSVFEKIARNHPVALINVRPGLDIEKNCMHNGIRGIFYEQDSLEIFIKGIEAVCKGEMWYSREVMRRIIQGDVPKNHPAAGANKQLTQREIEILSLVAVGAKNEEIADKLYVSPHTIKTHLYNIYKKLSVSNRLQATLWAAKHL